MPYRVPMTTGGNRLSSRRWNSCHIVLSSVTLATGGAEFQLPQARSVCLSLLCVRLHCVISRFKRRRAATDVETMVLGVVWLKWKLYGLNYFKKYFHLGKNSLLLVRYTRDKTLQGAQLEENHQQGEERKLILFH